MPKSGKFPPKKKIPPKEVETDPFIQPPQELGLNSENFDAPPQLLPEETVTAAADAALALDGGRDYDSSIFPAGDARPAAPPSGDVAWSKFEDSTDDWLSQDSSGVFDKPGAPPSQDSGRGVPPTAALLVNASLAPPTLSAATSSLRPADAPLARLLTVSGSETGREFFLRHCDIGVGRGPEHQIVLADPSVSRDQARLLWQQDHFVLMDLGSGNGTFVNGKRVQQVRLANGDELAFGNAAFRYLEAAKPVTQGAAQRPGPLAPAPPRRHVGWIAVVLLVTAGAGLMLYARHDRGMFGGEARRDPIFSLYSQAVTSFRAHRWEQAEAQFSALLGLDSGHTRGKRYLRAIAREKLAEAQWAQAQSTYASGDLDKAYTFATGILDSTFRPEARALLHKINQEAEARISRAELLLGANQEVEALRLLQTVEAIRPGRADVAELLVRANLRSGGSRTSPVSVSSRVSHRRSPGYSGALAQAHRAFVAGDLTAALQALDALNSEDAASLRDKIERFSEAYQNGSIEHHAKHAASAIRLLGMAKALEMQVSNGTSMLTETIDRQLADMYYVQGMQALSDGTLPQAYQAFRSAVGLVPDHSLSAHKLAELSQRAQQQFDAADKEADLQKARATLQAVLEIVPAESELYRKAKRRLDGMR